VHSQDTSRAPHIAMHVQVSSVFFDPIAIAVSHSFSLLSTGEACAMSTLVCLFCLPALPAAECIDAGCLDRWRRMSSGACKSLSRRRRSVNISRVLLTIVRSFLLGMRPVQVSLPSQAHSYSGSGTEQG
jgi:hypothetical protein